MNKPISLIVVFIVGIALLVVNKASEMKYARQDSNETKNISLGTEQFNNLASTSAKKVEISSKTAVIYTDSGFAPAVVTINAGGTVTFVNKSGDKSFSLIFNPTSQVRSTGQAGALVFKFEDAGEFMYSSASHPELVGVVLVE